VAGVAAAISFARCPIGKDGVGAGAFVSVKYLTGIPLSGVSMLSPAALVLAVIWESVVLL